MYVDVPKKKKNEKASNEKKNNFFRYIRDTKCFVCYWFKLNDAVVDLLANGKCIKHARNHRRHNSSSIFFVYSSNPTKPATEMIKQI